MTTTTTDTPEGDEPVDMNEWIRGGARRNATADFMARHFPTDPPKDAA